MFPDSPPALLYRGEMLVIFLFQIHHPVFFDATPMCPLDHRWCKLFQLSFYATNCALNILSIATLSSIYHKYFFPCQEKEYHAHQNIAAVQDVSSDTRDFVKYKERLQP